MNRFHLSFSWCLLLALIAGAAAGAFASVLNIDISFLKILGDVFINLVKLIVVPLVLSTLIAGIANLQPGTKVGKIAVKVLLYYMLTSIIAILIGLVMAQLFLGSVALQLEGSALSQEVRQPLTVGQFVLGLIPSNIFSSMSAGNILQIIVFALIFGAAIRLSGAKGRPIADFFDALADVMIKLTSIVMLYAPIAAFALLAVVVNSHGAAALLPLLKVLVLMYAACFLHILCTYLPLLAYSGVGIRRFFVSMFPTITIAFTTCSSAAALSTNLITAEKLGVPKSIAGFSIPLGNTLNMDGAAIYLGLIIVFASKVFNIELSIYDYLVAVALSLFASIGSMGVPGAILVMMAMVFQPIGIPNEAIALVAGIDRIMDMPRTAVNVMGDAVGAVFVSKHNHNIS